MQAADDVFFGIGMIVLHEALTDSDLRKHPLVVAFQKEAAIVTEHARLEKQDAGKAGFDLFDRSDDGCSLHFRKLALSTFARGRRRIHCCASAEPALPLVP